MVSTRGSRRREPKQSNETSPQLTKGMIQNSPQAHSSPAIPSTNKAEDENGATAGNERVPAISICSDAKEADSHAYSSQTEAQNLLEQLSISKHVSTDHVDAHLGSPLVVDDVNASLCANTGSASEMTTAIPEGIDHKGHDLTHMGSRELDRDNFGWLIETGPVITIDPLDTIPLACIRAVSDSGVTKLELAFLRSENGPGMSMGVSSAAPQPIVVQIPEDRLHYVVDYYSRKGLSVEHAHGISRSKVWYGTVEGAHRRKALINLGEKVPNRFKGYPWVVLCVDWQSLAVLRAFARERNEFQRGEHVVDFTMYDIFKNLKESADELAVREGLAARRNTNRGYLKRVADHYCGGPNTANNLTRQLAGIAACLSWRVIKEMGTLLNSEDTDRAMLNAQATDWAGAEHIDARVCKNLFTRSTFRGATTFCGIYALTCMPHDLTPT